MDHKEDGMKKQQKKLFNIGAWSVIILFILRCVISWESIIEGVSLYGLFGFASEAISVTVILLGVYEEFLWRINPFEKTPKLAKRYIGILKSNPELFMRLEFSHDNLFPYF